jgi:DNA-binding response OmpR family regulator
MPITAPAAAISVLLVDHEDVIDDCGEVLAGSHPTVTTSRVSDVGSVLSRCEPELIVTELQLKDGDGLAVCRMAKAMPWHPFVLVMTGDPHQVPDAIDAGCDGVLLKPFAPNLLVSRVSRLIRQRSDQLQLRSALSRTPAFGQKTNGTNRVFPDLVCPYCDHQGVTCFDFAGMRRAWYACLACRNVWVAKRREP